MSDAPERTEGYYWAKFGKQWLMLFLCPDGRWWSADMPVEVREDDEVERVLTPAEVEALRKENERLRALTERAYHEGWSDGAVGSDAMADWEESEARAAQGETP